jgi:hypothetical protein
MAIVSVNVLKLEGYIQIHDGDDAPWLNPDNTGSLDSKVCRRTTIRMRVDGTYARRVRKQQCRPVTRINKAVRSFPILDRILHLKRRRAQHNIDILLERRFAQRARVPLCRQHCDLCTQARLRRWRQCYHNRAVS